MIAILLCAGFGTRMYPLTEQVAKALLPVGGRPVLDYLMDQILAMEGLEEIHLVANNRFYSQFETWQKEIAPRLESAGITLTLYNDGVNSNEDRLGAVGDLHFVLEKGNLWGKRALVLAGDNIFMFDLVPLWRQFVQDSKNRILGIVEEDPAVLRRTGVIGMAED
ncbi:MAG TPA: sugar phosphate nucleotidyltransferase, partial [Anaerolineales bacterium]|nr:sugar phosphate nucleotidyltransferase [Anaerolineales bacterium]